MRILFVPELYRPDDATANGTLKDAVQLVEEWLDRDESLHVYWLLAPSETANYDPEYVHADRDRVTLVEAEPYMAGHEHADAFSETGYTEAQLRAVEAAVQPVELVGYVHDLRLPFKRHGRGYPNGAPTKVEMAMTTFVDGLWFKPGVDEARMRDYGTAFLDDEFLDDLLADALETGSPLDFSRFEERYADEPRTLHVAGSGWGKKNLDVVLDAAATLHDRFGIRTLMTNMDPIPSGFADREFVDAYPECSRAEYESALRQGDLAVCASDHETMARTPFEQAASGQVLVLRDRPWVYDCSPDDYRLAGDLDDLESLSVWAVEHWDEAVAANCHLVEYVTRVRDPERCGRRTYADLRERVERRVAEFEAADADGSPNLRTAIEDALADGAVDEGDDRSAVALDEVTAETDRPVTDVVYGLRSLGYEDAGNPGTPVFRPSASAE